jgi:hypothetical protein
MVMQIEMRGIGMFRVHGSGGFRVLISCDDVRGGGVLAKILVMEGDESSRDNFWWSIVMTPFQSELLVAGN